MMRINVGIEAATTVLCFALIVLSLQKIKIRTVQHEIYLGMVVNLFVSTFATTMSSALEEIANGTGWMFPVIYGLNFVFFLTHIVLPVLFVYYILESNGTLLVKGRVFYICFVMPFLIAECAIWITPFTDFVFSYNNYRYVREPGAVILYGTAVFYICLALYYAWRAKTSLSRERNITVWTLMSLFITGVIIQAFTPLYLEALLEAIALMGFLIKIEDDAARVDSVTGLYDKNCLRDENRRLLQSGLPYCIVDLDIRRYAYAQNLDIITNDKILREIADFLCSIYIQKNIYFHDNSRFTCIFYEEEDLQQEESIIDMIRQRFEETWGGSIESQISLMAVLEVVQVPEEAPTLEDIMCILGVPYPSVAAASQVLQGEQLNFIREQKKTAKCIAEALENDEIEVYYQPIYDCRTERIVSAEALVRLKDKQGNFISPEYFIPLAEKDGTIIDIGEMVFRKVCRFIYRYPLEELELKCIEVNLSVAQMAGGDSAEFFQDIMNVYGVRVDQINFEITETYDSVQAGRVHKNRLQLENMGFQFSLDDYGTGYSNISRVLAVPFKNIKMDKSLLWDAMKKERSKVALEELTHFVLHMGFDTIQEGVETKEQLELVKSMGVQMVQGFYFSKPLPEEEFVAYVRKFNGI